MKHLNGAWGFLSSAFLSSRLSRCHACERAALVTGIPACQRGQLGGMYVIARRTTRVALPVGFNLFQEELRRKGGKICGPCVLLFTCN